MMHTDHIRPRRRKYAAPIGGIFVILALVGLVTVIVFSVQFTRKALDNSNEKRRFEQMILPVVMFDPVPFEKVTDVDPLVLLQSSLWAALMGEKRESYTYDEIGRLVVPASDVDVACANLFGPEVTLTHQSFGDYEITYVYSDDMKAYFVPVQSQVNLYTPRVEQIEKRGDIYALTVGYIPPNNWTTDLEGNTSEPRADKYMIYEMKKEDSHYYLVAIKDPPSSTSQSATDAGNVSQQESSAA